MSLVQLRQQQHRNFMWHLWPRQPNADSSNPGSNNDNSGHMEMPKLHVRESDQPGCMCCLQDQLASCSHSRRCSTSTNSLLHSTSLELQRMHNVRAYQL